MENNLMKEIIRTPMTICSDNAHYYINDSNVCDCGQQTKPPSVGGDSEKAVVTPLKKLLEKLSSDDLFAFIHSMHMNFALSCSAQGEFRMVIYQDGSPRYKASNDSAKRVMIDAVAQFVVCEQRDFHTLLRDKESK